MPKIYAEPKYEPLRLFLCRQPGPLLALTLAEVEAVIDAPLPRSAQSRSWWRSAPPAPQACAWLTAGWAVRSVAPRPAPGLVTFVRLADTMEGAA